MVVHFNQIGIPKYGRRHDGKCHGIHENQYRRSAIYSRRLKIIIEMMHQNRKIAAAAAKEKTPLSYEYR